MQVETVGGQRLTDEQWFETVTAWVKKVEGLSVVKGHVGFSYGATPNLNKVYVSVWCCWSPSRRTFKQIKVCCDTTSRLTHLDALVELFNIIQSKHMCDTHLSNKEALEQCARPTKVAVSSSDNTLEEEKEQGPLIDRKALISARNAFEHIQMGQQLLQRIKAAEKALSSAGKREAEACANVHTAKIARIEAVNAREQLARELAQLKDLSHSFKAKPQRQQPQVLSPPIERPAEDNASSDSEDELNDATDTNEAATDDQNFQDWNNVSYWKSQEAYIQTRRCQAIDPKLDADTSLPRRGKNGWRRHWRRGLYGAIQDWAAGRGARVVHMLVSMAIHFRVEQEVTLNNPAPAPSSTVHCSFTTTRVTQSDVDGIGGCTSQCKDPS